MDKQYTDDLTLDVLAVTGDEVISPDDSTAHIVNGSGSAFRNGGKGYALVGSHLDNGDEIISTPQDCTLLTCHAGETLPDDFLLPVSLTTV